MISEYTNWFPAGLNLVTKVSKKKKKKNDPCAWGKRTLPGKSTEVVCPVTYVPVESFAIALARSPERPLPPRNEEVTKVGSMINGFVAS